MSATAYRLLGMVVWRVAKGYLRQRLRLPTARSLALKGLAGAAVLAAAALVAKRAGS